MPAGKKIAVIVSDRQGEALRMAVGLTLVDDRVEVYVLGRALEPSEENRRNLDLMKEMDIRIYSDCPCGTDITQLETREIAARLLQYDHVLSY